jgi:hypothetical protein
VRNTCRTADHPATFDILTTPTPLQRRAFDLVDHITAYSAQSEHGFQAIVNAR